MQKILLICLLSISTCLSRPEDGFKPIETPPAPSPAAPVAKDQQNVTAVPQPHAETPLASIPEKTQAAQTSPTVPTNKDTEVNKPTETNKAIDINKDATVNNKNDTNKTTHKAEVTPPKADPKNETVTTKPDKTESTPVSTEDAKNQTVTTVKPDVTTKSAETPKAHDTVPQQARGFDGPSFIGGIILTLGLLAIGFMGLKYYKNQTERNYHTL